MLLAKVKVAAAVVLGLVLLGGGGVLGYRTVAGEPVGEPKAAPAQAERAAPPDLDKLKAQLTDKEREVRELRDLVAKLRDELKEKTREMQSALAKAQDQADRAVAAEENARRQAAEEREARARAEEKAARGTAEGESRAAQVQQARDDVELLEAQFGTKKTQLKAAQRSLKAINESWAKRAGTPNAETELAVATGQVEVKDAEVKEAEVRLTQAKRRLAKLQGPAKPAPEQHRQDMGRRAADLEKRIDALKKELDGLRKDLDRH
jgi:chromosome segregation ATPase